MRISGSTHNCGIKFVFNPLEDIPQTVIKNRDTHREAFLGRFLARLAQTCFNLPMGRVTIFFLSPSENWLAPYFNHLGFKTSGEIEGWVIVSKYLIGWPRIIWNIMQHAEGLQSKYNDMTLRIQALPEPQRYELREKREKIIREQHEFLRIVPPKYLGNWECFSENNS